MPDPIISPVSSNACFMPADDAIATEGGAPSSAPSPADCSGSADLAVSVLVSKFSASSAGSFAPHGAPYLSPDQVLLCHRIADIPLKDTFEFQHQFLVTADKAAGAGHCGDGIPGHGAIDLPLSSMCINDHTKEIDGQGVACELVDANADCVDRELEFGKPIGPWLPPFNDCHTFVTDVLARCPLHAAGGAEGASSVSTGGANGT